MRRATNFRPDPYDGFKDDAERRRALNVRAICKTVAIVVVSLATASSAAVPAASQWLQALIR